VGGGCGGAQTLTGGFTQAAPAGGSSASVRADVPPGLTLQGVHLGVALSGVGATLRTAGGDTFPLTTGQDFPIAHPQDGGDFALVSLACDVGQSCPGEGAAFALSALALHVDDASPPKFSVGGWHSPTAEAEELEVSATDVGTGLSWAQASVDGVTMASAPFDHSSCIELSPQSGQVDLPMGDACPAVDTATLKVDPTTLKDGRHTLVVRVFDAAGNVATDTKPLETVHIVPGSPFATLTVGTSLPGPQGGGGTGGVAGATASSCRRPKLSMLLDQKPLRVSHGVPVLKRGKRYRFRGTLTCVVRNHRVAAPKRSRIDFLNKLGRRTIDKGGALTRAKGRVTFIVTALSTRTLVFRFADANGSKLDVKIKVKVAHR
jgi:hypothetical protein